MCSHRFRLPIVTHGRAAALRFLHRWERDFIVRLGFSFMFWQVGRWLQRRRVHYLDVPAYVVWPRLLDLYLLFESAQLLSRSNYILTCVHRLTVPLLTSSNSYVLHLLPCS